MRRSLPLLATALLAGCGGADGGPRADEPAAPASASSPPVTTAPLAKRAPSLGPGPRYRPPALGARTARALPVRGLRCERQGSVLYGIHLELFAAKRVVLIPPGIGIAPPHSREGAEVRGGRCSYPLRTHEPTGVVSVAASDLTLGDLFDVWGQPLSRKRMAGFRGRVRAFVGGRRWDRAPQAIPLGHHAQIVLEVGGHVPPHRTYLFPPGL